MRREFTSLFIGLAILITGCDSAIQIDVPGDLSPTPTVAPTATPSALPAVAAHTTLNVGSGTADNSTPITVTITLKDTNNDPVVGTTPSIEIVNSAGTYTITTACSYSDASGVSICKYKTFRGGDQIVRITSPAALTTVGAIGSPACASASTFFSGTQGSGTSGDPYQISSIAQFDQIRCLDKYFKLTTNLNLNGIGWFPAQVDRSTALDGQNHTISNLTIDIDFSVFDTYGLTSGIGAGLFGSNAYDGNVVRQIKNITFASPSVYARGSVANQGMDAGLIAAKTNHQISGITVTSGIVSGSGAVGGLVGYLGSAQVGSNPAQESYVKSSSFAGTVSYISTSASGGNHLFGIGGIVGRMGRAGGTISSNTFSGAVDARTVNGSDAGGIVGDVEVEDNNTGEAYAVDSNQVLDSTIRGDYFVGGVLSRMGAYAIFRQTMQPSVSGNYVRNPTLEGHANVGGIAGAFVEHFGGSHLNLYPVIANNAVIGGSAYSSSAFLGGLVGFMGIGSIQDSYAKDMILHAPSMYLGGILGGVTQSDSSAASIVAEIKRSYAAVTYDGLNLEYAAIVGHRSDATLTIDVSSADSYYDADLASASGVTEIAPLLANGYSTSNMKTATPFSGWSTAVWDFQAGSYPRLINNANP